MASNEKQRQPSARIGERLRAFRDAKGLRQEDVSNSARKLGFAWGRSSVAALEAGNRELSVAEFLSLSFILADLGGWDEPLLPPDELLYLSDSAGIHAARMPNLMFALVSPSLIPKRSIQDDDDIIALGALENERERSDFEVNVSIAKNVHFYEWMFFRFFPDAHVVGYNTSEGAYQEITRTIDRRLSTPSGGRPGVRIVHTFALGMWGRPPGVERDARTNERGDYDSRRALQSARGHVTRELIDELQEEINKRWPEILEMTDDLDRAVRNQESLNEWEKRFLAASKQWVSYLRAKRGKGAGEILDSMGVDLPFGD